jgi:hypothetical protein
MPTKRERERAWKDILRDLEQAGYDVLYAWDTPEPQAAIIEHPETRVLFRLLTLKESQYFAVGTRPKGGGPRTRKK